jgi:hypothetical protein
LTTKPTAPAQPLVRLNTSYAPLTWQLQPFSTPF